MDSNMSLDAEQTSQEQGDQSAASSESEQEHEYVATRA